MTTSVLAFIPSPDQGVWHLGPVPLRAYALCIIVGIVAALIVGDRRWIARGGHAGVIYDIALWAVPFGLVGGRLYHVMTDWRTYFGDDGAGFAAALRIWDGGLGIWGAVALGGVGAWIGCRSRGIPLPAFGDAIAPGIVLAQAIGRLGNYFNQELYGRPTTLPWGLEIYERRNSAGVLDSLNGVSTGQLVEIVHPTFLYELLWNLLVFALLIYVDRRFKIGHGRLFALYVAAYCVGRFWVELMRSDMATHIAGIRINTFTSTFVFVAAVVYIMVAPKGREDPETLKGNDVDDEASPLDEVGAELVAVAATSGVVAAATVAGVEDERAEKGGVTEATPAADEATTAADEATPAVEEAAVAEVPAEDVEEADSESDVEDEDAEGKDEDGEGEDEEEDDDVEGAEPVSAESGPMSEQAEELAAETEDEPDEDDEAEAVEAAEEAMESEASEPDEDEGEPEPDEAENEPEAVEAASEPEPESKPEEGLGSVEGDEVAAAEQDVPEVHEAAVERAAAAETVADEVAAETESADAEPEKGLGSVEGDDVAAAEEDVPEVREAAVEGAEAAEALADEVAAEPESAEAESAEGETESADAEPEEGLGSIEGDEVAAAEQDAPEVHEAAVEGAEAAEAVADEVAAEPESAEGETESADAEPEEGLGSVEGDEVAAAEEDAPEVHEAAVEGAEAAEAAADEVAAEPESAPEPVPTAQPAAQSDARPTRGRWWRRRG